MDPLDPQFDDPALRAAVRRAMSGQTAPASLRRQVIARLDHEDRLLYRWRKPLAALAAAAVLLIAFGVAAYMRVGRPVEHPIPQFIASAMVSVHDQYTANKLQTTITDPNLQNVRQLLEKQVGYPVMIASLGTSWTFQGADVVKVSNIPAAHALFTRGNQSISIFSLPASALYQGEVVDGTSYEQMEQGHPISGVVYAGAVDCLVASATTGGPDLNQLTQLRDRLRPEMMMHLMHAACPANFAQASN
jgi:hypothetical protein